MSMKFFDLTKQISFLKPTIEARLSEVLTHQQFIMGPEVYELEAILAEWVGVEHCITCANGTDALQLSLMALDIGPGDVVFTTDFSFFATAEVIPLVGATPAFCDINPNTYNLCPKSLEQSITRVKKSQSGKPKAVIAVDLFGLPAEYAELKRICDFHNLHLIEDAAQGFGGRINERSAGSFGDIATTSFFPSKPLGCFGDGGAIFTNDQALKDKCSSLRVHGKGRHKYDNVRIGLNSRLDTMQAAILLEKLKLFPEELSRRQSIADYYHEQLSGSGYTLTSIPPNTQSAWAQFTLQHESLSRASIIEALTKAGIPTAVYYPNILSSSVAFSGLVPASTPEASKACGNVFSIPIHSYLEHSELTLIVDSLMKIETQAN